MTFYSKMRSARGTKKKMPDIQITDNSGLVLDELERKKLIILEEWGLNAERHAKLDEITPKVYDTPQSPNYQRTGRLRGSITYALKGTHSTPDPPATGTDGVTDAPDESTVVVGTNVDYAPYVETGTSKMPPRPFIEPSVANYVDEYKKIMKYHLTE